MKSINVLVFSPQPPDGSVAAPRLSKLLKELQRRGRVKLKWMTWNATGVHFSEIFMADIIVFQREFCQHGFGLESIIRDARKLGKTLIYEIDDLLTDVHSGLAKRAQKFYAEITPEIKKLIKAVDFVTTSTNPLKVELEALGGQGKTYVVPNFIDMSIWGGAQAPVPYQPNGPFVLGYVGTPSHGGDMDMVLPAVSHILQKYKGDVILRGWGCLPPSYNLVPHAKLVRGMVPSTTTHAREIRDSRIDLAIAPLKKCAFNLSKSDIKFLEYAACYTPAVFSNVGPYKDAHIKHGETGWLVENNDDAWVYGLEKMIQNHATRQAIGIAAHDYAVKERSFDAAVENMDALYQFFYAKGYQINMKS